MTNGGAADGGLSSRGTRHLRRLVWSALGLVVVVLTAVLLGAGTPDLTVVLLVVLVEVLVIALVSGPVLAAVAALCAVVAVNWFDVPPYHTFRIDSTENVVALLVFTVVAVVAAVLVDVGGRARENAARAEEKATLIADMVTLDGDADTSAALTRIREALELDRVVLQQDPHGDVCSVGEDLGTAEATVDIHLPEGYRLVGYGPDRVGADKAFLTSLAEAAVRAHEGERLAQERRRADELAAIDRARTALLASVGHELRTPLAGLRVAVDGLRVVDDLAPADRSELLETVHESTDRLDELITNLLDMSRLEAGTLIAHREPTSLDEVVARALLGTEATAVRSDISDSLPLVDTDPALLERVVANLVSNALRHSGSSEPVQLTAERAGSYLQLLVVDHGVGFEVAEGGDPAWPRPTNARADGGSGLGLAIVRQFTAAVAAEVRWDETPGGGATVQVTLPVWAGEEG